MDFTYTSMLANLNVGSAHPGGFPATKNAWQKIKYFPHQTILDAGCGTGKTLNYLSKVTQSRLIGIDRHQGMLEQAKKRLKNKQVELILADLQALPLDDESIDCIFSESVSSFSKINRLLSEFHRVLRPDGLLHLIEITTNDTLPAEDLAEMNSFYGTETILTKTEWRDYIKLNGFEIIDTTILPATTEGKVELEIKPDTEQIYLDFLTQHFQSIGKFQEKLIGVQFLCQKQSV